MEQDGSAVQPTTQGQRAPDLVWRSQPTGLQVLTNQPELSPVLMQGPDDHELVAPARPLNSEERAVDPWQLPPITPPEIQSHETPEENPGQRPGRAPMGFQPPKKVSATFTAEADTSAIPTPKTDPPSEDATHKSEDIAEKGDPRDKIATFIPNPEPGVKSDPSESDPENHKKKEHTEAESVREPKVLAEDLLGSTKRRIEHLSAEVDTKKGWGEETGQLDQELQANKDFEAFLKTRDYTDDNGSVHDALTGNFKKREDANQKPETEGEHKKMYESQPLLGDDGLISKWAEVEDSGDKTKTEDIIEAILDRIDASYLSDAGKLNMIDIMLKQMENKRQSKSAVTALEPEPQPDTRPEPPEVQPSTTQPGGDAQPDQTGANPTGGTAEPGASGERQDDTEPLVINTAPEVEQKAREEYAKAVHQFAEAKARLESPFSGKKARAAYDAARKELNERWSELIHLIPEYMHRSDPNGELDQNGDPVAFIAQQVIAMRNDVSKAYIEARSNRYRGISKVTNLIRRNPKKMMAVGLGVAFVGLTPFAPIVQPIKSLLSAYGAYQAASSFGEWRAKRGMDNTVTMTADEYFDASEQESLTRRRWKRIGGVAAVGAGLIAAIPALTAHSPVQPHHAHAVTPTNHPAPTTTPPTSKPPVASAPSATSAPAPNLQPVGANSLPWDFTMNTLHTNLSSPDVLSKLVNNSAGITFHGNGLGNGMGQILSVTTPQGTFSDYGHINAAIQYILTSGA